MNVLPQFTDVFSALWGFTPFPWQTMLAERVTDGRWPQALDLPTASGKTACIDIALFALAMQADEPLEKRLAPRRLWFVVDRRIVVDEAFDRARMIADKLAAATDGPLKVIADRLRKLAGTDRPLAVARLRGGVLRDDGWARLPSQPAVITSTVDQLGSRLLFRGYGRSQLTAPIFAGLAANDSLVLLDEAHCSVPFLQTLRAVERYRGSDWTETPLPSPFAFVVMSATPPSEVPESEVFPGAERDKALDHDVLRQRLTASKQAELVELKAKRSVEADPLVQEAADRAQQFANDGKQRIAVMVNRVATAGHVADLLEESVGDTYQVVLLIGRLRPYERDQIVERWKPFLKASSPKAPEKPIILVTTQCLEVGADFSFDALVTEAASLDALRQRFGRLDRMGSARTSRAIVLVRTGEADPQKSELDPIYGAALAATWKLLKTKADTESKVDFGIDALRKTLEDVEDLTPYLAPTKDAPVLLPAHLDLLCQTAPTPWPEPDVPQYLHGIGRGAPEVQVVWRADLGEDDPDRTWVETVAMCRPLSGEMLTAPLWRVRSWLGKAGMQDAGADIEGTPDSGDASSGAFRRCLLWRGRRSKVVRAAEDIAPGDVVVVPAAYGMAGLARPSVIHALGREQADLWERVMEAAGRPAAVRLNRAVTSRWLTCEPLRRLIDLVEAPTIEREALQDAIDEILTHAPMEETQEEQERPPDWWVDLLRRVRAGRVERHPAGGVVLRARSAKVTTEEPDLFADDDDLTCVTGREQSLDEHSRLVRQTVEKLVALCLPESLHQVTTEAAYLHDVGKLDERFQILLHQGDELAALAATKPLAKSASIPVSPAQRRALREASGLPESFRHEMLSTQLATVHPNPLTGQSLEDLFLHLIASHHGHARPLAPICEDPEPPPVRGMLGDREFSLSCEKRREWVAHRVHSGLADRFWRLTRRYGWWGLAYLEAILRLGDWYASGLRENNNSDKKGLQP
ncbi:MAG: type I-U CRISPR-associated helicase/endonuclease Cas3 [Acidobacteria bacterium]|nr:type I-U CRISPR-associated helicase/endonuclease Cas3 [Acidobacteriota bacterium]